MNETTSFRTIDAASAIGLVEKGEARVLDARDRAAYDHGHIAGAEHLTEASLRDFLQGTPKKRPVLIYCALGHASEAVAQTFAESGFAEVFSLEGGYEAFANAQVERVAAARGAFAPSPALRDFLEVHGFPLGTVNSIAANGMTPLMRAAVLGPPALVAELLRAGARVDARNGDGNEALWLACVGDDPEIVGLLVAAGADLDHANVNGSTALMYAASAGKAKALAKLLEVGADLEIQVDGVGALDMAATLECLNLMRAEQRRRRQAR